jgi:t-SNARE complex subunit (syntaxin)
VLAEIEARYNDIVQLESSIHDLSEMMIKDMAALVQWQGDTVDRIDDNVEDATELVARAHGHVRDASKEKRKKKKIIRSSIAGAVSSVAGVIVVLIILI